MDDFINPQEAETRGPRKSRKLLFWLLIIPLGMILICGGLCIWLVYTLNNSTPYKMALEQVQQDPQVIEKLGSPIEATRFVPAGNINIQNDTGEAVFNFDVAGPNGTAHVRAQAKMIDGTWGLTTIEVNFSDGQRLMLGVAGVDDAPAWTPPADDADEAGTDAEEATPPADLDIELPEGLNLKFPNLPAP